MFEFGSNISEVSLKSLQKKTIILVGLLNKIGDMFWNAKAHDWHISVSDAINMSFLSSSSFCSVKSSVENGGSVTVFAILMKQSVSKKILPTSQMLDIVISDQERLKKYQISVLNLKDHSVVKEGNDQIVLG